MIRGGGLRGRELMMGGAGESRGGLLFSLDTDEVMS